MNRSVSGPLMPPHYTVLQRLLDVLMLPVMVVVGGFRPDSLQRTHFWHLADIDPGAVARDLAVDVAGDEPGKRGNRPWPLPLYHMAAFGGWRHYTVLEAGDQARPWFLGWIHLHYPDGFRAQAKVHGRPIRGARVRVFRLPVGHRTLFFAVDGEGRQIPLRRIGDGRLPDHAYPGVPLY